MTNLLYLIRRIIHRIRGRVVHQEPKRASRGNVLISYMTLPYLDHRQIVLDAHTNRWECMQMARTFLERGYAVDIIDFDDKSFIPQKRYAFFLDVGANMERIAPLLNSDCKKIFHGTTGYWRFFVDESEKRLDAIEKYRGVRLPSGRKPPAGDAIRFADTAIMLGSKHTIETYPADVQQKISRIPLSTTHTYPSPEEKDIEKVRRNFIWFGGAGLAHKGVDLVLEAFAVMPEYTLTLVGKISPTDPFAQAYKHEMYETPNIKTFGWLDPGGDEFKKIYENALGIVYPSCSEGCAGSVVLCMHAGLIPIVSFESGVDTGSYGVTLKENSIKAIQDAVRGLATTNASELRERAIGAWNYARANHTRERFAQVFGEFIDGLEDSR